MKHLKRLATARPVVFALLITCSVWVFYIAAAILAEMLASDPVSHQLVQAAGRVCAAFFFLWLLGRFGWQEAAGVTRAGAWVAWLVALLILAYELLVFQLPFFDDMAFKVSYPGLSLSVGLNALVTGLIEELPFRGIILYTFLRLWGDTRQGIIRSFLVSALFFSSSHLIHVVFGHPFGAVAMKVVMTFLSSVYYTALVLRWRSIWTVVLMHGVQNAYLSMRAVEVPGFSETAGALGVIALLQLPLVAFGAYLIFKSPPRPVVPQAR